MIKTNNNFQIPIVHSFPAMDKSKEMNNITGGFYWKAHKYTHTIKFSNFPTVITNPWTNGTSASSSAVVNEIKTGQ